MIRSFASAWVLVVALVANSTAQNDALQNFSNQVPAVPAADLDSARSFTRPVGFNGVFETASLYDWNGQSMAGAQAGSANSPSDQFLGGAVLRGELGGLPEEDRLIHRFAQPFAVSHPSVGTDGIQSSAPVAGITPKVPLPQFTFENIFKPESYGGSGYANEFKIQPVIPVVLKPGRYFEYHVLRPTLPILAPVTNPDGPAGEASGIGDLQVLDLYFHTIQKGLVWGIGPFYNFPTSTSSQTGSGDWQIGPAFSMQDSRRKHWVTGFLIEIPFSLDSDAYSVKLEPTLTRLLPNRWYVGWGDLKLTLNNQNGGYDIPLSLKAGKIITAGKQPINILVQPQYTPAGFHSGSTTKYGVKLAMSFSLTNAYFGYKSDRSRCGRGCLGCRHCR